MKNLFVIFFFLLLTLSHSITLAAKPPPPSASAISGYIVDGDTFAAKVKLEEGAEVSVRVRILHIDAPELKGECEKEIEWANRSRNRLAELLPEDSVIYLTEIKDDKYLGRIDASVKLADGRDIGEIMLRENLARPYNGGKRQPWCD